MDGLTRLLAPRVPTDGFKRSTSVEDIHPLVSLSDILFQGTGCRRKKLEASGRQWSFALGGALRCWTESRRHKVAEFRRDGVNGQHKAETSSDWGSSGDKKLRAWTNTNCVSWGTGPGADWELEAAIRHRPRENCPRFVPTNKKHSPSQPHIRGKSVANGVVFLEVALEVGHVRQHTLSSVPTHQSRSFENIFGPSRPISGHVR